MKRFLATAGAIATLCALMSSAAGAFPVISQFLFNVPVHIEVPREVSYFERDRLFVRCDINSGGVTGLSYGTEYVPALGFNGSYDGVVTIQVPVVPNLGDNATYHCYMQNENQQDPLNFRTLRSHLETDGRLNRQQLRTGQLWVVDK